MVNVFVGFTATAAVVIPVLETTVSAGNNLNKSPFLSILENAVPVPFTRVEPEVVATVPEPVTYPLI